jgi:hypothetical protein
MQQDGRRHELAGVCTNLYRMRESVWCNFTRECQTAERVAAPRGWQFTARHLTRYRVVFL